MKHRNLLLLIAIAIFAYACQSGKKQDETTTETDSTTVDEETSITLVKKWETDTLLTTVESVIHDEQNGLLYAACISGAPDEKDGVGFIAKVDMDGNILDAEWVTGLHAPKGMAIYNNSLFATDIDKIVEVDITTGELLNSYEVEGAQFLNDADVDSDGNVYVSDMRANQLVKISNGELSVFMDSVSQPNGVFAEGGSLITAYWEEQKVKRINTSTMEVSEMASGIENPDGIEAVGDGGYLVSSWNGKVSYVDADGEVTLILDTTDEEISAADIEYIPALNLLLVPTFFNNTVVAYELQK